MGIWMNTSGNVNNMPNRGSDSKKHDSVTREDRKRYVKQWSASCKLIFAGL